jgi:hypothetical protein
MISYLKKAVKLRIFLLRWFGANKLISLGRSKEAFEKLDCLQPPDSYKSIVTCQQAACLHRLGQLDGARDLYALALEREKSYNGRRSAQNGQYIRDYCNYFILLLSPNERNALKVPELDRLKKKLRELDVSSELKTYVLPPPN